MHLITGFAGTDHVTSANDGVRNAQIVGNGRYVIAIGRNMEAQEIDNNTVRIYDGYGLMDGRFFEIPKDTYEDVTIENGTQAQNRIDLICVRYEISDTTGIETTSLVVVKGTPSATNPQIPSVNEGNILNGDMIVDFPLYKVTLNSLEIASIEGMYGAVRQGFVDEIADIKRELQSVVKIKYEERNKEVTIPANYAHYQVDTSIKDMVESLPEGSQIIDVHTILSGSGRVFEDGSSYYSVPPMSLHYDRCYITNTYNVDVTARITGILLYYI